MNLDRSFFVATDHNSVGSHEVVDGRTFAQELGVRGHAEISFDLEICRDEFPKPLAGTDRYCRFRDEDLVAVHRLGDVLCGLLVVAHVGRTVRLSAACPLREKRPPHPSLLIGYRS
jgi:hypothetical protein